MLVVTMPEQGPQLGCVVRTPELYLVPRRDGRIVVGATVEDAGFDRAIREEARDGLLRAAGELWPPILEGRVTDGWTGLRPSTPDSLPLVGALDLDEAEDDGCSIRGAGGDLGANHDADQGGDLSLAQSGMLGPRGRRGMGRRWIATGHFRNGILLAPGTARVVRQLILGERPEVDLVPFRAGRFVPAVTGAASGS
jgi:glycine oxidase